MGSSMQSAAEKLEMSMTGIESPLENMVEEAVEEAELEMMEEIGEMESHIGNISENTELLTNNMEEVISSPLQNIESSVMTENILSEMASSPVTPTMMGNEVIEEMTENIEQIESMIPSSLNSINTLTPLSNHLPSSNMQSTMEQIENMTVSEGMMPYPSSRPLSSITSQTGGNYISPSMRSIQGMGNLRINAPYPSMTGLTSPLSSTMQQLESQINQSIPGMQTIPSLTNQVPKPYTSPMTGSMSSNMGNAPMINQSIPGMQTIPSLTNQFPKPYTSPMTGSMSSNMGNAPMTPYQSNMGLLSPLTSSIQELESEIEAYSSPLMDTMNLSQLTSPNMGSSLSLPSTGSTLQELEQLVDSNSPFMGTMPSGGSWSSQQNTPKMPPGMGPLTQIPSMGSTMGGLEQNISGPKIPCKKTMPMNGSSLPLLQKPNMGGYLTSPQNKENIQPFGGSPYNNMGYSPGSGSSLLGMLSPFQNLPLMNRFVSPFMNNSPGMQQSMSLGNQQQIPNNGLWSPLRQAMSNLRMTPNNMLQQPSMPNMPNSGSNAMMSSPELSELISLINQDSMLPSSQKKQFLNQMSSLSPSSLGMMQNMYLMMGNDWQSRLRQKIEMVRRALKELTLAIEAMLSGNEQEMRQYIMAAISILGNSPITTALQYAMNQDSSMLSLIANMSRLILGTVL
ncbi:hypothetical protein V9T40_008630 [Parthenolecanium corni]|uniref:Uncharacterized protein n=1 Tax=Parthenolecanium corni TaxID=536013 RepID=A0AAN9Y7C4_9HEMI